MKLHHSQTNNSSIGSKYMFNTYMKLHHSQTTGENITGTKVFNTYMKLHHSQTRICNFLQYHIV